jgi:hypothetical protein
MPKNFTLSRIGIYFREWAGNVLNLAGLSGSLRARDRVESAKAEIRVRVVGMLTVVTINGMDIYFHRLAGNHDGVGVISDWAEDQAHDLVPLHASRE